MILLMFYIEHAEHYYQRNKREKSSTKNVTFHKSNEFWLYLSLCFATEFDITCIP